MKKTIFFIAILLAIVPFVHATKVWTRVTDRADIQANEPIMLVMEDNANNRWILKFSPNYVSNIDHPCFKLEEIVSNDLTDYNRSDYVFTMSKHAWIDNIVYFYMDITPYKGISSLTYTKTMLKNSNNENYGIAAGMYTKDGTFPPDDNNYYWLLEEWGDQGYFKIHTGNIETKYGAYLGFTTPHVFYSQDGSGVGLGPATTPINQWATNQTLEAASTGGNMAAAWSIYKEVEIPEITLDENSDNSTTLVTNDGKVANVTIKRSLSSASYNTLVLPFDLTAEQIKDKFGTCTIQEFTGTSLENEGQTIVFEFTKTNQMKAGVPYLIQPTSDVTSDSYFEGVTIDKELKKAAFDYATFEGIYSPAYICEQGVENQNVLFVGAENSLYWPSATSGKMKGMRAYFELLDGAPALVHARFSFVRQQPTELPTTKKQQIGSSKKLIKGRLVIVRDDLQYSVDGQLINRR